MKEIFRILKAFDEHCIDDRQAVLITLVNTEGSTYRHSGARALYTSEGGLVGLVGGGCIEKYIAKHAEKVLQRYQPRVIYYDNFDVDHDLVWGFGLGCAGAITMYLEPVSQASPGSIEALRHAYQNDEPCFLVLELAEEMESRQLYWYPEPRLAEFKQHNQLVQNLIDNMGCRFVSQESRNWFVEKIQPPQRLLVFGAGVDAVAVTDIADMLGWRVHLIDHRQSYAQIERFPKVDSIHCLQPEQGFEGISITKGCAAIVMTHHYKVDSGWLPQLLQAGIPYIALLGSVSRRDRLLAELKGFSPADLERIHGPAGLDLGAETPEEIALAMLAEAHKVLKGRSGLSLRDLIHEIA